MRFWEIWEAAAVATLEEVHQSLSEIFLESASPTLSHQLALQRRGDICSDHFCLLGLQGD